MTDEEIVRILCRRRSGEPAIEKTTAQQYMTHLRNLHADLGDFENADADALRDFIAALPSAWSRRRAVSALRRFYGRAWQQLGFSEDPSADLVNHGFCRPQRGEHERTLEGLANRHGSLRNLTWSDIAIALLGHGQTPMKVPLSKRDYDALRALIVKTFPTTDRLFARRSTCAIKPTKRRL